MIMVTAKDSCKNLDITEVVGALYVAAENGDRQRLRELIVHIPEEGLPGSHTYQKIIDKLVHYAASENHHLLIDDIMSLSKSTASIEGLSFSLAAAAEDGFTETVETLIKHGADVHVDNDQPLKVATMGGKVDTVASLVRAGADIHATNDRALKWAMLSEKRVEFFKALTENGVSQDTPELQKAIHKYPEIRAYLEHDHLVKGENNDSTKEMEMTPPVMSSRGRRL